jgi:GIY-YIG catalytic domain-containing protein
MGDTPDQLTESACAALLGQRYSIDDAVSHVPDEAGLYAVYATPQAWQDLGLELDATLPAVYVGKAERSLSSRDVRTHFARGRTGSSTLRRSLAALLRDPLGLTAVPRNTARPDSSANFGLRPDGEDRLSAWMHEHLSLATWVKPEGADLDAVETGVLRAWQPPLNLSKVATPSARLKAARRVMADEARAWRDSVD